MSPWVVTLHYVFVAEECVDISTKVTVSTMTAQERWMLGSQVSHLPALSAQQRKH